MEAAILDRLYHKFSKAVDGFSFVGICILQNSKQRICVT